MSFPAKANQCYPSDPAGVNLLNPCPNVPSPDDILKFIHGSAFNAYFGKPVSPSQPGTKLEVQPNPGFFWTEIKANENGLTIKNSTNRTIQVK